MSERPADTPHAPPSAMESCPSESRRGEVAWDLLIQKIRSIAE